MSARGVLRLQPGGVLSFWCPGCREPHSVGSGWSFNGSYERPTFTPSVLVTSGHYTSHRQPVDACWCTYNAEHPDALAPFKCGRCHSFVTDGRIQFLPDSTHELAGQTVALEPF